MNTSIETVEQAPGVSPRVPVRFGQILRGEKFSFKENGLVFQRERTGFKSLPADAHNSRWFPLAMSTLVFPV